MRIGELAAHTGINPTAIRFYESIGLLPEPARTSSGYRQYGDGDAERLVFVKTAQRLGLSLDDIREILAFRDRGEPPCAYVMEALCREVADIDRRIGELFDLRAELVRLTKMVGQVGEADAHFCTVIEHARRS